MSDAIVKLFGVIVLSLALIFVPIVATTQYNEVTVQRLTLNTVQNYLDVVTDKGTITVTDYENFLDDLHAIGLVFDVSVTRNQRMVYKTEVIYMPVEIIKPGQEPFEVDVPMHQGDEVIVHVRSIGKTQGEQIAYSAFGLYIPNVEVTLGRVNRN